MSAETQAVQRKLSKLHDPGELHHRKSTPNSSLCGRCLELRLEEAIGNIEPPGSFTRRTALDVKIADVGQYYRQKSNNGCKLCHMLSVSRVTIDQASNKPRDCEDGDELHVFELCEDLSCSLRPSFRQGGFLRGRTSLYLAVVPSGFTRNNEILGLHGERNGFITIRRRGTPQLQLFAPQVVSPLFDLSMARHWLQYCKKNHERLCSRKDSAPSKLHLIDCHSLKVIPAPFQADYLALSYVWGVSTAEPKPPISTVASEPDGIPLESPVPAVIADAISVTLGLGFYYLWVDRYCINQDSHSKHEQINQMDLIYQQAELTIIAAAGDDPEFGLPGITSRARCGQHTVKFGDLDIIPILRHPHFTIRSSRWSTRGWTFQESALSRRNLAFTDDQVYFECNAMNCHESLLSDLDTLHVEDKSQFMEILQSGLFGRTEKLKYGHFDKLSMEPDHNLVLFMGMIEQYTARDLTYAADSLNAFTGIIRKFTTPGTHLSQIRGVPLCHRRISAAGSFRNGLGWSHKTPACGARDHPRRRPEFPSWSWAGWAGEIQYKTTFFDGRLSKLSHWRDNYYLADDRSVDIETGSGLKFSVAAYINKATGLPQDTVSPAAIHLQAYLLPPSAFSYDVFPTTKLRVLQYPARLALSVGPWDIPHFIQSLRNTDQRRCIYLGEFSDTMSIMVLMVLEAKDDSWSRIGLVHVDQASFKDLGFRKIRDEYIKKSQSISQLARRSIGMEATSYRII